MPRFKHLILIATGTTVAVLVIREVRHYHLDRCLLCGRRASHLDPGCDRALELCPWCRGGQPSDDGPPDPPGHRSTAQWSAETADYHRGRRAALDDLQNGCERSEGMDLMAPIDWLRGYDDTLRVYEDRSHLEPSELDPGELAYRAPLLGWLGRVAEGLSPEEVATRG